VVSWANESLSPNGIELDRFSRFRTVHLCAQHKHSQAGRDMSNKGPRLLCTVWAMRLYNRHVNYDIYDNFYYGPAVGGIKRYRDPSVCLSHGAAALGARLLKAICTLAACSLAMCGLRTRPRTEVDPPRVELHILSPPPGR